MFPYPDVEAALTAYFRVSPEGVLALRAKFRNLQRLGMRREAPGRGRRVLYSFADVCDYALALSFSDFGIDPRHLIKAIPMGSCNVIVDRFDTQSETIHVVYRPDNLIKTSKGSLLEAMPFEGLVLVLERESRFCAVNFTRLELEMHILLTHKAEVK